MKWNVFVSPVMSLALCFNVTRAPVGVIVSVLGVSFHVAKKLFFYLSFLHWVNLLSRILSSFWISHLKAHYQTGIFSQNSFLSLLSFLQFNKVWQCCHPKSTLFLNLICQLIMFLINNPLYLRLKCKVFQQSHVHLPVLLPLRISSQNNVPYSNQSIPVSTLSVSPLPFAPNFEFLPLLITSHHYSFTLGGTFYSPPNFDTAFGLFKNHISFLSPIILHNLIPVGDFNINLLKSFSLDWFN